MDATKLLKLSIITQWFCILVGIPFGLYEETFLPEVLQAYIQTEIEKELTTVEIIEFSLSIVVLFIFLYTSIAVYRLRQWARKPYAVVLVGSVFLYYVLGVVIATPIAAAFDYIATLSAGLSLGLLYYSQVSHKFEKTSNK